MADGVGPGVLPERTPGLSDLLARRSFRILFGAELQSLFGDQLARVALAVLVYSRTDNAVATALTYAATFLPALLGAFVLARVGDHKPRLAVMVTADVARLVLFGVMAVPGLPLWVLEVLLVAAVFLEPAFTAAQSSYLAQDLEPDLYRAATAMRMASGQIIQIVGFAVGGALVALIDPRGALIVDAVTYGLSAVFIRVGLRRSTIGWRSMANPAGPVTDGDIGSPSRSRIRSNRRVVSLIALTSLAGLFVVPEGLAIPYAHEVGASTRVGGLLLAAVPAGGAVGALMLMRLIRPARRHAAMSAMAVLCGVPLLVMFAQPAWPVAAVAWFLSGIAGAYQVEVFASLGSETHDSDRARVLGLAGGFLTGGQGIGLALFGLTAQVVDSGFAIGLASAVGIGLAAVVTVYGGRSTTSRNVGVHRAR